MLTVVTTVHGRSRSTASATGERGLLSCCRSLLPPDRDHLPEWIRRRRKNSLTVGVDRSARRRDGKIVSSARPGRTRAGIKSSRRPSSQGGRPRARDAPHAAPYGGRCTGPPRMNAALPRGYQPGATATSRRRMGPHQSKPQGPEAAPRRCLSSPIHGVGAPALIVFRSGATSRQGRRRHHGA